MANSYPTKFFGAPGPFIISRMDRTALRHNRTREEVRGLYNSRLLDLVSRLKPYTGSILIQTRYNFASCCRSRPAAALKTAPYCPQSAHYETGLGKEDLLSVEHVLETAREARSKGVTRFCMGAAWRQVKDGEEFESVLEMVRGVASLAWRCVARWAC